MALHEHPRADALEPKHNFSVVASGGLNVSDRSNEVTVDACDMGLSALKRGGGSADR
jgi:hypothetical protein